MARRIHLGRQLAVFLVLYVAVLGQQGHRLDGKGEHRLGPLVVEPAHEAALQPVERIPVGPRSVGEEKVAEQALEIVAVVVGDVPENGLEVPRAGRLVDRVDDLLEAIGDDLVERTALERQVDDAIRIAVIVRAVLLPDEVVQVHQELGRRASAAEHAADDEDHVDESSAERFQVRRLGRVAADRDRPADEPRVHRDAGAVVGHARLVVLVDEMPVEQLDVTVGHLAAVHLFDPVAQQPAVQPDEVALGELADQRGDVLVLDVRVRVVLAARSRILGVAVVDQKGELVAYLAVLEMLLPIDDEGLGDAVVAVAHQRQLDLILDFLHARPLVDVKAGGQLAERFRGRCLAHGAECLFDGRRDFVHRKRFVLAVPFDDVETGSVHCSIVFVRCMSFAGGQARDRKTEICLAEKLGRRGRRVCARADRTGPRRCLLALTPEGGNSFLVSGRSSD